MSHSNNTTTHYLVYIDDYCLARSATAAEAKGIGYGLWCGMAYAGGLEEYPGITVCGVKADGKEYTIITFGVDEDPGELEKQYVNVHCLD